MATNIDKYCHRIGRTGRAGKNGRAVTLLTEKNADVFFDLRSYLESCEMPVPRELAMHAAARAGVGARDSLTGKLLHGEEKGRHPFADGAGGAQRH